MEIDSFKKHITLTYMNREYLLIEAPTASILDKKVNIALKEAGWFCIGGVAVCFTPEEMRFYQAVSNKH